MAKKAKRVLVEGAVDAASDYLPDVVEGPLRRLLGMSDLAVTPKPKRASDLAAKPSRSTRRTVAAPTNVAPELQGVTFKRPGQQMITAQAAERGLPVRGRTPFAAQHGAYSGLAATTPADAVQVTGSTTIPLSVRQTIQPSDLEEEGAWMMPLLGDKTRAGFRLEMVNGRPQAVPIDLHGGMRFMDMQQAARDMIHGPVMNPEGNPAVWGSGSGIVTRLTNQANKAAEETGGPVFAGSTIMGPNSADQTTFMTDLIASQIRAGGVRKGALKAFDDTVRTLRNKEFKPIPDFVGFADDAAAAAEQMRGMSGGQRRSITQLMDKGQWLSENFPEIGANRVALTKPDFVFSPEGASGYNIAQIDTGRGAMDPRDVILPHPTYAKQMSGTRVGGFEYEVPRELMWPDFFKRAERGEDISPYTFSLVQPMQRITPEWSDNIARYLEAVKKYGGSDYAEGGAVEAPDYDYAAAEKAGVKPDERGHMPVYRPSPIASALRAA